MEDCPSKDLLLLALCLSPYLVPHHNPTSHEFCLLMQWGGASSHLSLLSPTTGTMTWSDSLTFLFFPHSFFMFFLAESQKVEGIIAYWMKNAFLWAYEMSQLDIDGIYQCLFNICIIGPLLRKKKIQQMDYVGIFVWQSFHHAERKTTYT